MKFCEIFEIFEFLKSFEMFEIFKVDTYFGLPFYTLIYFDLLELCKITIERLKCSKTISGWMGLGLGLGLGWESL